jgi:hypothetical protein
MRSRHPLPAALVLCALVASGCTGGSPEAKDGHTKHASSSASPSPHQSTGPTTSATIRPTTSATPSPSATATHTLIHGQPTRLPQDQIAAAAFHVAVLDRNAASTPEERTVVDAWMKFWQAASDTYYFAKPTKSLERTSTPAIQQSIVGYMKEKKAKGERVVGWAKDNVLAVHVDGDRATVHDCTENYTFSINEDGDPVTRPTPWYDVTGTLRKVDGSWVVASQRSVDKKTSCLS